MLGWVSFDCFSSRCRCVGGANKRRREKRTIIDESPCWCVMVLYVGGWCANAVSLCMY
jgi:hypothetical protein